MVHGPPILEPPQGLSDMQTPGPQPRPNDSDLLGGDPGIWVRKPSFKADFYFVFTSYTPRSTWRVHYKTRQTRRTRLGGRASGTLGHIPAIRTLPPSLPAALGRSALTPMCHQKSSICHHGQGRAVTHRCDIWQLENTYGLEAGWALSGWEPVETENDQQKSSLGTKSEIASYGNQSISPYTHHLKNKQTNKRVWRKLGSKLGRHEPFLTSR